MLGRGDAVEVIGGETPSGHHRIIVMEFPDVEQARGWHTTPQNYPGNSELREMRVKGGEISGHRGGAKVYHQGSLASLNVRTNCSGGMSL